MTETAPKCIKRVGKIICTDCDGHIIKYGKSKCGKQRYQCKGCRKVFIEDYTYEACNTKTNNNIIRLTKEGCGIRSIARLLKICCRTVQNRILDYCSLLNKPVALLNQTYEVDELCTYIGNKSNRVWIAYSYCRDSREVADFVIGSRSKAVLQPLINNILRSFPFKIYTDKHQTYTSLIPVNIHSTKCRGTNHIERKNLSLRTHLKRLSRRTICFSKSSVMLSACLKIYFWG